MFPVEFNSITGFDKSTSQKHYCLFCLPDKEWAIARQLMQLVPKTQAFPLQRLKRKTVRGVTTLVTEILFPRYVFIETSADIFSYPYQQINGGDYYAAQQCRT